MKKVIIIGAGVVGSAIARTLSAFNFDITLIEKNSDVGTGTSKGNSAIVHTGFDAPVGSLEAEMVTSSNPSFDYITEELGVEFNRTGALLIAFNDNEIELFDKLIEKAKQNNVNNVKIVEKEQLFEMEPNINSEAKKAIFVPDEGGICPFNLVVKRVMNAVENGVKLNLNTKVIGIKVVNGKVKGVETENNFFEADYVINAAGLYSDQVAQMVGIDNFSINPRKGEFIVFDKKYNPINHIILPLPSAKTKGILIFPSIYGNLIAGPTAEDILDKEDTSTTEEGLNKVVIGVKKFLPNVNLNKVIKQYAGLRAAGDTRDFIININEKVKGFVNVAQIRSTGVSASPAISFKVLKLLEKDGVILKKNENFNPKLKVNKRFAIMSDNEKENIIFNNPKYGKIVCRCENVTEAEIINAINHPVGAKDVDGIKRRTRAGMGRCQGCFCGMKTPHILARELNIPLKDVKKKQGNSKLFKGKIK